MHLLERAMRVAFVTHYSFLYGANRSLLNLIDGLKEFKIKSFVLCPSKGDMTIALKERNVPFSMTPFKSWMGPSTMVSRAKAPARLVHNLVTLPFLIKQVKKWNADVIYTNSSVTPIGALIAIALKKPHVWHIREFGELDYRLHHDWGRKVFKQFVSKANAVIAISNAVKRIVLDGVGAKTYVIYNGVVSKAECDALKEQTLSSNKSQNYTFAIVGILHPNKGQEHALRALAYQKKDHPNIHLLIVGSGSKNYTKYLKTLSKDLGIGNQVEFWGYVSDPFAAYLKADAVLMCSKYEAMGRVTAEAMATARPVIGYNSGGTAEIVENDVTGLLYNGDYKNLSHCMAKFVENPKWSQKLGLNGWEKAREEYTIEVYAERVYSILREAVNRA